MDDIEINSAARGIMNYLTTCGDPNDALAIMICVLLIYYERAVFQDQMTIEEFADKLKIDITSLWSTRNIPVKGPETIQ